MSWLSVPFQFKSEHGLDEIQRRFRFKQDIGQKLKFDLATDTRANFTIHVPHPLFGFTMILIEGTLTSRGKTQTIVEGIATPYVANFISLVILPLIVFGLILYGLIAGQSSLMALGVVMGLVSALGYWQRRNHVGLGVQHYFNRIFYH